MSRPRFEVEKCPPREVMEVVYSSMKDKDGKHLGFERKEEKRVIKDGFMAYFPHGHSIFVESVAKLRELGLHEGIGIGLADDVSLAVTDPRLPMPQTGKYQGPTPKQAVMASLAKQLPTGVISDG